MILSVESYLHCAGPKKVFLKQSLGIGPEFSILNFSDVIVHWMLVFYLLCLF